MARVRGKLGLLLLGGVAAYIVVLTAQSRAAENLCESYTVGAKIDDAESMNGTWLLTLRGPIGGPQRPDTDIYIFCAALTMCDVSCRLEVTNSVVTDAAFRSL